MDEATKTKSYEEITEEAENFQRQFRVTEEGPDFKEGLTPTEVLGKLGFKEIPLTSLDPVLVKGIKKHDFYGHPLKDDNNILLQSPDGMVIYTITHAGKDYRWSRIEKSGVGYMIHQLNHDANIAEMIDTVAYYEINYRQDPKHHPIYKGMDIVIDFQQEAREKVKKALGPDVLGLA